MLARMIAVALGLLLALEFTPPLRAELIMRPPPPVEVKVRPGVTIKYLALVKPKTTPRAAVILFAGGNGLLSLQPNGTIGTNLSGNFLVRSRDLFVQQQSVRRGRRYAQPGRDRRQRAAVGAICAG